MDDASEDDTATRLQAFGDRIRYERVRHGGAGWARNSGIDLSRNPRRRSSTPTTVPPGNLDLQRP